MSFQFTVLAVLPHYPANAPRFLVDAFEQVGYQVIRAGAKYFNHTGLNWPEEDLPKVDIVLPKETDWFIDDLIDQATRMGVAPDMVFISEENYKNSIINTEKIPSVLYSCDGWPENYNRADAIKATINMTNHPLGIDDYPREEIDPRWEYLPGAAAPWIHRDLKLERDYDFCMLASFYGRRKELSDALAKRGFKIWSGQAVIKTYVEAYNRSLVTFHNARRGEVKWRWWEAAAMGCVNISGLSKLFPQLGYKPWIHYYPIDTPLENEWPTLDDLAGMIKHIKNAPEMQEDMARAARRHTLLNHTYLHRVKQIFNSLDMIYMILKAEWAISRMWEEEGFNQ